jgi:hypothetical protein
VGKKIEAPGGNAAGRDIQTDAAPKFKIHLVSGGNNIIGNQGDVHVQIATASRARPKIVVQPGPEHISPEQKLELATLRDEWMTLHAALKKKPLSHGVAWNQINKAAGATSYHLILRDRLGDAVAFVKQEMAKLRNMRSAPAKDDGWRAKRIGAIKARCKNQLDGDDVYRFYIRKMFKADSLTELSTDQLQRTYTYIMGKRRSS